MADYWFDQQLVASANPFGRAINSSVTVYDINDTANATPLALKDVNGLALANPLTSSGDAFTPGFFATVPHVKFVAGTLTVAGASFKALRDEAVAAKAFVQGITVGTVAQGTAPAVTIDAAGKFNFTLQKGADGRDGANILPTDTAIAQAVNDTASQTAAALAAGYVRKQAGRVVSRAATNGTDQTAVLQGEIDSLAAAGGGDLYLPVGTITVASLVLRDFVNLVGVGKLATVLTPTATSTAAGFVTIAAGPVRARLSNLTVQGKGLAGQRGLYIQAVGNGGTPNHGGWWNSGLDNVMVRGFANDQIWLRGGGTDFLKPHQFLTLKDVEAYTTGTAAALRMTGQVAQVDFLGHCEFDGPGKSGATGTNIVITREVTDALANVSDVAPSAIRFGNVTTQNNKRGYTIERGAGVVIEGGWWENLAEGLEANAAAPLVRARGVYAANVGANGGAGWVMKATGGALVLAEENTFAGVVDKHFINSLGDGIIQRNNVTTTGAPVITEGLTVQLGIGSTGDITLGSARDALVNTALLAAPVLSTPTTATTGGTLAAATYFYKATYTNAAGETVGSNEISQATTGATSTVTFTIGVAPSGATGTKIYRSTTTGTEVLLDTLVTTPTTYTDNGSKTPGTATVPATNTTNTPIVTITSKAGPGERVSIKAWGGALVLNSTGNINASGLTMPYTVPSNALVTLVKYDLGAVWNIENISTQ